MAVFPAGDGGSSSLVVTYVDYDEPNFGTFHVDAWSHSSDNGVTFAESPFPDPAATGVTDEGDPGLAGDPLQGAVYAVSTGGKPGTNTFNELAFFVAPSPSGPFAQAVNGANPSFASSDFVDVPCAAVDTASAQGQGRGDVYTAFMHFTSSLEIDVSRYSGGTFTQAVAASRSGSDAVAVPRAIIAPNRYVHVVYYSQVAMQPAINMATSRNQNVSYDPEKKVAALHVPFIMGDFYGELGVNGTGPDGGSTPVAMYASPQIAANPVSGDLYVVYADSTQGVDKANVYFVHSQDSGMIWSLPVQVNDDMTTNDQFLPAIAVSPDGTRLAIDFYDRRDDPNNVLAYRYGVTADIAGAKVTFGPNFRVSAKNFPILVPFAPGFTKFSVQTSMGADGTYFYDAFPVTRNQTVDIHLARYGVLY
jgi:hypothetical protein